MLKMMSPGMIQFIPVATTLVALIIGFAFDPTSARPMAFSVPVGILIGLMIQRFVKGQQHG